MESRELNEYCEAFETIQAQAEEMTRGLTEAQFNWRPAPDQWSIEECLAHLILVGTAEIKLVETAVEQGRSRRMTGKGPFRYGAIDRLIIDLSKPPARRKFPAPRKFQPLHGQPITGVLPTFCHLQRQLRTLAERADGLDLARVKVKTPISRFLRMSLGGIFAQIAAHERRHMEQARRVREALPAAATLVGHDR